MKTMDFLKGMGAGMVVGAALGMVVAPEKRGGKKRLSRMFRAAGDVIEDISGAIGL
ncbi:MAG: YtxH domain-containing protein [Ruminococcaceae bacterium]|nr:YtxH domain-containing protein [Oscillospiraceae bacterium]